jgi:hypothetical protein
MFLGTPHRGSKDVADLGNTLRRIASAVARVDTSSLPLMGLALHTTELERCQEAFSRLWALYDFRVKTFQEGLALTGFNWGALGEKVINPALSLVIYFLDRMLTQPG